MRLSAPQPGRLLLYADALRFVPNPPDPPTGEIPPGEMPNGEDGNGGARGSERGEEGWARDGEAAESEAPRPRVWALGTLREVHLA